MLARLKTLGKPVYVTESGMATLDDSAHEPDTCAPISKRSRARSRKGSTCGAFSIGR